MKSILKIILMAPFVIVMMLTLGIFVALMAIFGDLKGLQGKRCASCGDPLPECHRGQICGKEHCQIRARWDEARKGVEKV